MPRRGHAQWPQPERDRDRQTAKRQRHQQRQRQRRKTPAGNAVAALRVAVSSSTCVHDVVVAGTRALSLSFALCLSTFISMAISFQLTSLVSEYCWTASILKPQLELSRSRVTSRSGMLRVVHLPCVCVCECLWACVYLPRVCT